MNILAGPVAPAPDGVDVAWQALAQANDPGAYFSAWLTLLCTTLPGATCAVVVLGPPDTGPFSPRAFWPEGQSGAPRLADPAERALAERKPVVESIPAEGAAVPAQAIAVPIEIDGHLLGMVAIEVRANADGPAEHALSQVQLGLAWVEAWYRRQERAQEQDTATRLMTAMDLVAAVLEEERFDAACRSLVTELALRLGCDRVSIGALKRGRAEVVALSHTAQFGKRMNLVAAVGAAMDEAIDQKAVIRYPSAPEDEIVVTRDHAVLAADHGSGSILTVPVAGSGEFAGAITCERPAAMPFSDAEIELVQSVGAVVARVLETKKSDERSLLRRALSGLRLQAGRLVGPRYVGRKLFVLALIALTVFLSVATGAYRVTAPSTLEGEVRRSLAAPFDGYIASAGSRAGDVAPKGTVLATLDDRDLRLERLKASSQYAQYLKQHREAVANRDRAKAQVLEALYEQAKAQMDLYDEQVSRAAIRAPFDGVVVKGDLSQSLGSAVKRGDVLFELTPLDAYRVVVNVDERDIASVAAGQRGTLVLASLANEAFPFTVRNVTAVTTAREGRNFFRVEGSLEQPNERLRPGMEGVGKIEIDERRLVWIWTHRMVNWLRLFVWTYLP